jgi:hypothetical protein
MHPFPSFTYVCGIEVENNEAFTPSNTYNLTFRMPEGLTEEIDFINVRLLATEILDNAIID